LFEEDEPSWYDTAQVCLNGHLVNKYSDSQPEHNKKFCDRCGEATTTTCSECKAKIKGYYHIPGVSYEGITSPPKFCDNCGKPFPWTNAKLQAAIELAGELENLSEEDREILRKSLPEIIRDTSQTSVAATRFKKLAAKARDKGSALIWNLIKDIASEAAKKIILGG
jgi:hypothetical protein